MKKTPPLPAALAPKTKLEVNERIIRDNIGSIARLAIALNEIKEQKLYESKGFKTWPEYIQKVWGWSREHVWGLIQAGTAMQEFPQITSINAGKAVAKLPPAVRSQVVAAAGPKPTEKSIQEAAEKVIAPAPAPQVEKDETGFKIPPELKKFWSRNQEVSEVLNHLKELVQVLKKFQERQDPLWAEVPMQEVITNLSNVFGELKRGKSYAVCPDCNGIPSITENCTTCHKRGTVSKFFWDTCIPEEKKAMRK